MRKESQDLSWLGAIRKRGPLSNEEEKSYQRSLNGLQGEVAFDQLYRHFLGNETDCLDDVTLEYKGDVLQMDKIFKDKNTIHLADIKNYQGNYVYENNALKLGSTTFANDIIEQARRSRRIFTRLFEDYHLPLEIQNVIVFINDQGRITLYDDLPEIVLNYEEIPGWLMKMRNHTQQSQEFGWQNLIQKYQIPSYATSRICSTERLNHLKKGIHCEKCGSFSLKSTRYTFQCLCGHVEIKQIAFLRTICEYGIIMHHLPLKRSEIIKFFGEKYPSDYIKKTLSNYFVPLNADIKDGKYQNYGQPFNYWFENEATRLEKLEKRKNWHSSF
ncbi:nuclease-related domain-containing protein [Tetragenococcus koreensis]|uniref:nuclease-related domain-containing protein n=1 Tax=Tetragenococcus koreensis TaxID=290335 RepID=UPI001F250A94|nr:nuclease-related domain-containing protein [Tetragenococcus koreensis]MCF1627818.1 NERD domain-containing protein [Tetragenococcus koreensis]